MKSFVLMMATAVAVILVGCYPPGPSVWDTQAQDENDNAKDVEAYCYTEYATDELLCEQAKEEKKQLERNRENLIRAQQLARARKEREYQRCLNEKARAEENYQRCLDRRAYGSSGGYQICTPSFKICLAPR